MQKVALFLLTGSFIIIYSCSRKETVSFGALSKLEGKWIMEGGENPESNFLLESWTKVNDTLFTGTAYEVVNNDSSLAETIRLVIREDKIYYIPSVTNQNDGQPVPFLLTKSENNKFVFENKEHDFPNTIVYEFNGENELEASVAGTIRGELRSMEFSYKRK